MGRYDAWKEVINLLQADRRHGQRAMRREGGQLASGVTVAGTGQTHTFKKDKKDYSKRSFNATV